MDRANPNDTVYFDPSPAAWPDLVRAVPLDETTRATRLTLGLSADVPVVMAGHQPGFWHPGILSKWLATHALAERIGGQGAWVVVDQSPGAGARFAYPALRGGQLTHGAMELGDKEIPPASQRPARLVVPSDVALSAAAEEMGQLAALLARHVGEASLARQLHAACVELLGPRWPLASSFASDLHTTPAFAEMVGAMRSDPSACARLYNEAATAMPEAGVRELAVGAAAVELPLWERSETPGPWRTVTSDRLTDLPNDALVLRGLPMTGLLRWRGCDLFIHGIGGGASHAGEGYDRVTERWLAEWLGVTGLAPAVVASATLRLDFGSLAEGIPTTGEIARARAAAHRAEHDPGLLGDAELGRQKRGLASAIAGAPRHSDQRRELFREMHALRERGIRVRGDRLRELREHAATLAEQAEQAGVIADRAWPWPFHDRVAIDALSERVRSALSP